MKYSGIPAVTSFAQITSNVTLQNQLKTMYGNVNNIDLWIGALSEDHVAGADVGPLMLAGLLDQFTRLRDGDRLWFTNDSGLTSAELSQVENVTLAGIIEANTGLTNLQANVFLAAVPEPAGWELVAVGMLGMACYRQKVRRRKFAC